MIERNLRRELEEVGRRYRSLRTWSSLAACWSMCLLVGMIVLWWAQGSGYAIPGVVLALAAAAAVSGLICIIWQRRAARDHAWIARQIESRFPDLDARLLAALEQTREDPKAQFGYLQQTVIREALAHARHNSWEQVVSGRLLRFAKLGQAALLILFGVVLWNLFQYTQDRPKEVGFWPDVFALTKTTFEVEVEPGDADIERGTSLLALARFNGPLPADVQLLYREGEDDAQQLRMTKSLDDPLFAGRVQSVHKNLTYSVRYGDAQTQWYKITVFDYPDLIQADARLKFPDYTAMTETVVEDTRSVTAVEGTQLTLICRLNKPVAEAFLAPSTRDDRAAVDPKAEGNLKLTADPKQPAVYSVQLTMKESKRYRLHLIDAENRRNKQAPEIAINVTPNRPPELKLASPARDTQVSPLQELSLKAGVWDDFGLKRVGLSYSMAGQPPKEITLAEGVAAKERKELDHLVAFEALEAEPDQLLSYYFWAEDAATDGSVRRTSGDMFFAEVRPFEEIFRQGEQPPGGEQQQQQSSQNAQQAEELAELQKQIINATWKLIRREISAKPSDKYAADVKLVDESEAEAKEKAAALDEKLQDPRSKAYLETVLKHMDQAIAELQKAVKGPAIDPLQPALSAEQAAYQALLKLRAREHNVVRGNRQQGGGGGGGGQNRMQQQLDQLELSSTDNRYESQRSASPQQEAEQRETRQVLNRLRELAQRQEDLNKQIKELQSSLEQARDEAQKEEIRRQLARLRDQQQQMLRDTDELRDRMDRPENQERMTESREQLEQTRQNIRRASEALEQGIVSAAAAAGERASQDLNNLRDRFRQDTAGQFTEQMNQMREDARKLDENQQQLSEKLAEMDKAQQRSLRDASSRQDLTGNLQQQKQELERLLEEMRQTVEEAETAEPLLSKQLYDTIRETHQQKTEQALDVSSQLLERGFLDEARIAEAEARRGIGQLREGVEQAAESVLGDETEALRRARSELDSLAEQLSREINRGRPGQPGEQGSSEANQVAQNQNGQNQPGQNQPGQQNGENQNGQPGENSAEGQQQNSGQQAGQKSPAGEQSGQSQRSSAKNRPRGLRGGQENQPGEAQQPGGQQPGEQPSGDQPGGEQPGEQQGEQPGGQQPGEQQGQEQGGQQVGQQQGGQQQGGQQPGEQQGGQQQGGQQPGGQQPGGQQQGGQQGGSRQAGGRQQGGGERPGDLQQFLGGESGPGGANEVGPLTGPGFQEWSDRLRDVEEMVSDPRLRAEAARIRDRARSLRAEFKRHSKEPNWGLVQEFIGRPLVELRDAVAEELLRRQGGEEFVPIDREPVPPQYAEQVRRYYERLGSGE